jgi:hypothetical protein
VRVAEPSLNNNGNIKQLPEIKKVKFLKVNYVYVQIEEENDKGIF